MAMRRMSVVEDFIVVCLYRVSRSFWLIRKFGSSICEVGCFFGFFDSHKPWLGQMSYHCLVVQIICHWHAIVILAVF